MSSMYKKVVKTSRARKVSARGKLAQKVGRANERERKYKRAT